jgi:hypothetical protein
MHVQYMYTVLPIPERLEWTTYVLSCVRKDEKDYTKVQHDLTYNRR